MKTLSLIVPCFNECEALPAFMEELQRVLPQLDTVQTELYFIDDGSTDDTLPLLCKLAAEHAWVHYVSFSRNFGKEAAMLAGLREAKGDFIALLDADLQDPPALLPDMLKAVTEEGYDCAATRRTTRTGEPRVRSFFASRVYAVANLFTTVKLVNGARDYRLFTRPVADALLSLTEYNRFSKGLFEWVGFRTKWFEYKNIQRVAGKTKWSLWQLFRYLAEGVTAFSTKPLLAASLCGAFMLFFSFFAIVLLAVRQYLYHNSVDGWTSMVIIILFLSGLQLFFLGIFGQYFAKMYMELKHRPHYIVAVRDKRAE